MVAMICCLRLFASRLLISSQKPIEMDFFFLISPADVTSGTYGRMK